jgi:3-methyladenine DNA glycosylase AlkD
MWYSSLFSSLEAAANPEEGASMAAYMQNRFGFLGIPKPALKAIIKPYLKEAKKLPLDWDFIELCWQKDGREAQYTALEYLASHDRELTPADLPRLKTMITTKSWWDTVDTLDGFVGELVQKDPSLETVMLEWSKAENIWLRRVSIDFQQKYKEQTNTALLEQILVNNLGSKEFFINKAIGWSLRDYSKVNPAWVSSFIEKYQGKMDKLSIKEAGKYL